MNLKLTSTFLLLAKFSFQPLSASFHPCNWHLSALLMLVEWPLWSDHWSALAYKLGPLVPSWIQVASWCNFCYQMPLDSLFKICAEVMKQKKKIGKYAVRWLLPFATLNAITANLQCDNESDFCYIFSPNSTIANAPNAKMA